MRLFFTASVKFLVPGLCFIIILASCAKDDQNNSRSQRLKSLAIANNYTMPAYTDSSAIYYHYNDKNQQVAISLDGNQDSISVSYGSDGRVSGMIFVISGIERHNFRAEWTNNQMILYRREDENSKLVYYFNEDNLLEKVEGSYLEDNEWKTFRYDEYQWENGNPVYFESYLLSSKANNHIRFSDDTQKSILRDLIDFSASAYKGRLKGATLKKEFSSRISFDTGISPYFNSPVYRILIFEAWALYSRNNPAQMITDFYNSAGTIYESDTTNYIYEYNNLDLPVKRTANDDHGFSQNATYTYE